MEVPACANVAQHLQAHAHVYLTTTQSEAMAKFDRDVFNPAALNHKPSNGLEPRRERNNSKPYNVAAGMDQWGFFMRFGPGFVKPGSNIWVS